MRSFLDMDALARETWPIRASLKSSNWALYSALRASNTSSSCSITLFFLCAILISCLLAYMNTQRAIRGPEKFQTKSTCGLDGSDNSAQIACHMWRIWTLWFDGVVNKTRRNQVFSINSSHSFMWRLRTDSRIERGWWDGLTALVQQLLGLSLCGASMLAPLAQLVEHLSYKREVTRAIRGKGLQS